ncbi:MAG: CHAP domain-containing protein [Verrucomicrobia bacterium]|jgi:hypothetical protein|nr:CHAP domain-containing protein [Verrucomicrobiota bacterium]
MKWHARKILTGGLLFVGGITALLIWNAQKVGKTLDSYHGVPVYDNGLMFFRSYGRHYAADGYYYGQKWQCVEFIKRFYHDAKGHKMPDVMGHARSFFDETIPADALNPRRGLVQYLNGSTEKPRPDDLLVFTDTKYGHVGIITETGADFVEIIQQNILGHTRQRLSLVVSNGHYFVAEARRPAGWLRQEVSKP